MWATGPTIQPLVLEVVDLGPFGGEEVKISFEHCTLCQSNLPRLNNEQGISERPVVLGHEVIGRVTAAGSNATGLNVGQEAGVGGNS